MSHCLRESHNATRSTRITSIVLVPRPPLVSANTCVLSILLNACASQAKQPVLVYQSLPGEKFFFGKCVSLAGFVERQQAPSYGSNYLRFAVNDPTGGGRGRQIRDSDRTIWSEHMIHYPLAGIGHSRLLQP